MAVGVRQNFFSYNGLICDIAEYKLLLQCILLLTLKTAVQKPFTS